MLLDKINIFTSDLRKQLRIIWIQDKILLILFLISLILNLALYFLVYLFVKPSTDPIFLHYSVYFGIDLIGQWYRIFFMPVVGTFLLIINFALTLFFYKKEKVASYLLTGLTLVAEILLTIGGILLIWINYNLV